MFVLGLTGSIGMGKSTVAKMFTRRQVPVIDADQIVHELYGAKGGAVGAIQEDFPQCIVNQAVDRQKLAKLVIGKPAALKKLESLVHPLVAQRRKELTEEYKAQGQHLIVVDIPLLYETDSESSVDAVLVVSASKEAQRQRVLERPNMTVEKFDKILASQIDDEVKRSRADFVIRTDCSIENTEKQVEELLNKIKITNK